MSETEHSSQVDEVRFRLSLLRLTGQHAEPLEDLLTSMQPTV